MTGGGGACVCVGGGVVEVSYSMLSILKMFSGKCVLSHWKTKYLH